MINTPQAIEQLTGISDPTFQTLLVLGIASVPIVIATVRFVGSLKARDRSADVRRHDALALARLAEKASGR